MFREQDAAKSRLIQYVADGEQDQAARVIREHPEYLLFKGNVTDKSGRTFTNISAFQYALWAMDVRYMCGMMIDCLPRTSEGEAIKDQLLPQYNALERDGVNYSLRGENHNEKHYDMGPLINALETYCSENWTIGGDEQKDYWHKTIGKLQYDVPVHVAQHYCVPNKTLEDQSPFKEENFERTLIVSSKTGPCNWYHDRLGVDIAISRGGVKVDAGAVNEPPDTSGIYGRSRNGRANLFTGSSYPMGPAIDKTALRNLNETRKQDLAKLKTKLTSTLQELDAAEEAAQNRSSCVIL